MAALDLHGLLRRGGERQLDADVDCRVTGDLGLRDERELAHGQRLGHDHRDRHVQRPGVPEERVARQGIDRIGALALDRRDLVGADLVGGGLPRKVGERVREGEGELLAHLGHPRDDRAAGAEVGVGQLQEIAGLRNEEVRGGRGGKRHSHRVRRKERLLGRSRRSHGDPVVKPGKGRVAAIGRREIG